MAREHVYTDHDGKGYVVRIEIEQPALVAIIKTALAPYIHDYMEHDDEAAVLVRDWLLGHIPDYRDRSSPFYGTAWFQMARGFAGISDAKKATYYKQLFDSFPHWTPHGHRTPAMTDHPQDRYAVGVIWPAEDIRDAGVVRFGVCYFNSGNPPYAPASDAAAATLAMAPRTRDLIRAAALGGSAPVRDDDDAAGGPDWTDFQTVVSRIIEARDNPTNAWARGGGNAHHVAKWNRVLEAIGYDTGTGVAPMAASEIHANAAKWPQSTFKAASVYLKSLEGKAAQGGG